MSRTSAGQERPPPEDYIDAHLSPAARARKAAIQAGRFPGFRRPQSNYYKSPNELTNIKARIIRNGGSPSACVVLDYILRHTWGYQEYGIAKRITLDEFTNGRKTTDGGRMDLGTGLSQRTIVDALTYLERNHYILVEVDDQDRGRIRKYYQIAMDPTDDEQMY